MPKKQKRLPLVHVEWVDSKGWERRWDWLFKIEDKPNYCESVGYLLKKKKTVCVIPHLSEPDKDGDYLVEGAIAIPKCAVVKITRLMPRKHKEEK
jgi:hypothetical protein